MFHIGQARSLGRRAIGRVDIIVVALVAFYIAAVWFSRSFVRSKVSEITSNALTSVVDVERMRLDLYREGLIAQRHVHQKDRAAMESLARELADIQRDFAATARAYEPLVTFPGEAPQWKTFRRAVAAYESAFPRILDLSFMNRDEEAQRLLDASNRELQDADAAGTRLSQINIDAARESELTVGQLLLWTNLGSILLALIVVALTTYVVSRGRHATQEAERSARDVVSLQHQNKELDAFAGRVAHDLRGPLQILRLTSWNLSQRLPEERGTASVFDRCVSRLDSVISDLLALSRTSAASVSGASDPAKVTAEIRSELLARPESQGAEVHLDMEPALVACSEGLLRQAIWNLVENGLKYSRRELPPVVEVHGRAAGDSYAVRVSDNGIGMSQDDAGRVFEPFYRGANTQDGPSGTGLGLAIVKRVADAAGGTVAIVSELGRGTTFVLTLPCRHEPAS